MTSTRLPGKVLMRVGGRTLLEHHLSRLAWAGVPVIVATTINGSDDPIVEAATALRVEVFRGSEHDVLSRYARAARMFELSTVVRVTADCPLIDGRLVAQGIERFVDLADPWGYVSNVVERTYPRGMDFEVFGVEALLDADANATMPGHREHVTPYLNQNISGRMNLVSFLAKDPAGGLRVTVDTQDDLTVVTKLIECFDAHMVNATGIVNILRTHPELAAVNAHVEQKKVGD